MFQWTEKNEGMILPEERLPWGDSILMGLQHVLAMFGATVLAPMIMGFDPNICLFFSGLGTIIFFLCVGGRVPSYLGSSFAFIGPVLSVTKTGSIEAALGGIMAAGFVYAVIGVLVMRAGYRWIDIIMPPVVTGSVVMIIGLNLAGAAKGLFMKDPLLGVITLISALAIAVYTRGFASRLPILLGCLAGYMAAFLMGKVDLTAVINAPWFGFPHFMTPHFELHALGLIAPVAIILVVENTGHFKALSALTGRNLMPFLGKGFLGDALATMAASCGGGSGVTTYAENIGVMAMTRVFSTLVYIIAAATAIAMGLCPKFGALILTIPPGVIGGIATLLFGMIAATGARIWGDGKVNFSLPVNLFVVAVTLIIGAADFTFTWQGFTMGGIGLGTLSAIVIYQFLKRGCPESKGPGIPD
jgi:putative pyrimidine permease RutG